MVDINEVIAYSKDLKVLYVEDNSDAREMTAMILDDFFESVVVAVDGEDGFIKFQENDIDVVITDINMPKMNGLDMSAKIRELDEEVPIVVISAHNEDNFFIESIEIGINGYLLKPINIEQLTKLLYRVIQKYKYAYSAKENLHLLQEYQEATNNSSLVSKTDTYGIITHVNDAFCKVSGYTKEELIGKNHNIVRHPENPKSMFEEMWRTIKDERKIWKGIVRNRAKNGKSYYVDSLIMPIQDLEGNILEYISLRHDITEIMNPLRQLEDELKNAPEPLLVLMKLEDFDDIEEFYDTQMINAIEEKVRLYLQNKLSAKYTFDKLYHLGDGEYAFVLNAQLYKENMALFIRELKELQAEIKDDTVPIEDLEYDVSVLISLSFEKEKIFESVKLGIKKLIKNKKRFIVANNLATREQQKAKENMRTVLMIKDAIKSSRIISYFQPIIHNQTQEIAKYESLVRLVDSDGKVLSPYFFLETAKKSNYYLKITDIVLEHSFVMLKNCSADISINLSALDIEQKSMRRKILSLLEEYKKDAHRIVFELLEDEGIKDFSVVKRFISMVKEYGVKIAIDDFGAGYSNFERLLDYQPDILKIDGCLIRDIETSSYSLSAVKSIVTFAKEQKMQTVAEFIENESIFNIVKEIGVDYSQGYYFGKPEPLK